MSGEKFIASSTEGADKEVTPAAARTLLGSSGRDFATVAVAEAATYTEPEHCFVKATSLLYQYDSNSTATRDGNLVLNTGGTGRLIAVGGVVYDPTTSKILVGANFYYDVVNGRLGLGVLAPVWKIQALVSRVGQERLQLFNNHPQGLGIIIVGTEGNNYFIAEAKGSGVTGTTAGVSNSNLVTMSTGGDTDNFIVGTAGAAPLIFMTGGVDRGRFDTNGNLSVGAGTTPTARAHVKGSTSDSSSFARKYEDSTGKLLESLRADGLKFHDGAIARPALTITADVTLTVATRAFLILDFAATGGVVTFPASPEDGQEFHPENIGTFSVTLARNGKLINGAASNVSIGSQSNGYYKYDTASGSWWSFD